MWNADREQVDAGNASTNSFPGGFHAIATAYSDYAKKSQSNALQNIGQLEVDREIIARGVLRAARTGERDAHKLCERAIHGLTAFDYRQRDE